MGGGWGCQLLWLVSAAGMESQDVVCPAGCECDARGARGGELLGNADGIKPKHVVCPIL
jgi:hypothetical protein